MTPADRILKAAHAAIDAESTMLNGMRWDGTHMITIRLKPRGLAVVASLDIATREREV